MGLTSDVNAYQRQYRANNRDRVLERERLRSRSAVEVAKRKAKWAALSEEERQLASAKCKKYREENAAAISAKEKAKYRRYLVKNLVQNAKYRARKFGLEHTITADDIVLPDVCPILGIPLGASETHHVVAGSYTIDRKDPMQGYTPENTWVISNLANGMKNRATPEQLLKFANWAVNTHGLMATL